MNYLKKVLFMLVLATTLFSLVSCKSEETDTGKKSEPTLTVEQRKEANIDRVRKTK